MQRAAAAYVQERWDDIKIELKANADNLNLRLPAEKQKPAAFAVNQPTIAAIAAEQMEKAKLAATATAADVKPALQRRRDDIDAALKKAGDAPLKAIELEVKNVKPDNATCERRMQDQGYSWKKVKTAYLNSPQVMWEMIQFRKTTVDGLIKDLNGKYRGVLVAKSVGSNNLTSDYDITLSSTDGSGQEIDAISDFNAAIKRKLRVPPGVCFDTNLYAKDFLKVKDNILDGERDDREAIAAIKEFLEEDRSDQDVAALTKQRQYMGAEGWDDYKDGILKALPAGPARDASRAQLEEAETLYITKCVAKTTPLVPQLEKFKTDPKLGREAKRLLDQWAKFMAATVPPAGLERLCDEIGEFAHEHAEAEMLEVNNDVYMEKMRAVRDVQKQHQGLEAVLKNAELGAGDFSAAMPFLTDQDQLQLGLLMSEGKSAEAKTYLAQKVDALKARAKKEVGEANFFASEAYLSEGPLQHIVNGKQSNNPEVFASLKPEHFLGSINEQFGDFMKDVGHFKGNDNEGFCQTSKYLERLLDGITLLRKKEGFADLDLKSMSIERADAISARVKAELLPIRGSAGKYAQMTDEERFGEAGVLAQQIYGVSSMSALTAMLRGLVTEVNAEVRKALTMRPDAAAIGAFGNQGQTPADARAG